MRFRIWGIGIITLFVIAFMPLALWALFNQTVSKSTWIWILPFFTLWSSVWIYLFRRGWFPIRFGFYGMSFSLVLVELVNALYHRQVGRVGGVILGFTILVLLYQWLENQVASAPLNAMIPWHEGDPKVLPKVRARIQLKDQWFDAQVRRIDQKGLFVIFKEAGIQETFKFKPWQKVQFQLDFDDYHSEGDSRIVSMFLTNSIGLGLQIRPKDLYHFSQYTRLVERLKGEGYAS